MRTKDFYYDLPENLIAQVPLKDRTSSKLMLLDKKTGEVKHEIFKNILNYIQKDDVIVFNNTRVLPARLYGVKKDTGANIEILLLKRIELNKWQVLVKPAKRVKIGSVVTFGDHLLNMNVLKEYDEGIRDVEFSSTSIYKGKIRRQRKISNRIL